MINPLDEEKQLEFDAYQAGYLAGLQQAQTDEAMREKFVVTFGVEYD